MRLVPFRHKANMLPLMSLFDDFFGSPMEETQESNTKIMPLDIEENENDYVIKANLPGLKKKDVKISIEENELSIKANSIESTNEQNYIRRERYNGSYQRSLKLSENCNSEKISANMEDGVLIITIPKVDPKPKKEIIIN